MAENIRQLHAEMTVHSNENALEQSFKRTYMASTAATYHSRHMTSAAFSAVRAELDELESGN